MRGIVIMAGVLAVAGCTAPEKEARYMAGHFRAEAQLKTVDGASVGTAVAEEVDGAIRVTVEAHGLPKGERGTHVHTTGKCEAPDFASAGGHWNPGTTKHGKENPLGPHAGDLPNLKIGDDGRGRTIFTLPGGTYAGLLDEDGAALVVHAGPDDYKTDPSGNSGGRVACGVFQAM